VLSATPEMHAKITVFGASFRQTEKIAFIWAENCPKNNRAFHAAVFDAFSSSFDVSFRSVLTENQSENDAKTRAV
jgi:hypothetical protein